MHDLMVFLAICSSETGKDSGYSYYVHALGEDYPTAKLAHPATAPLHRGQNQTRLGRLLIFAPAKIAALSMLAPTA
jgi:hypothetical protein